MLAPFWALPLAPLAAAEPCPDVEVVFARGTDEPPVTIGPPYAAKTIELCVPGDPVCSDAGNPAAHRQYVEAGMVDQAADFAAGHL